MRGVCGLVRTGAAALSGGTAGGFLHAGQWKPGRVALQAAEAERQSSARSPAAESAPGAGEGQAHPCNVPFPRAAEQWLMERLPAWEDIFWGSVTNGGAAFCLFYSYVLCA